MNSTDLYKSFCDIDDDILERSEAAVQKRNKLSWLKWSAMVACCCLVVGVALFLPHENAVIPPVDSFVDNSKSPISSEGAVENSSSPITSEGPDIYDDSPIVNIITFNELDSAPEMMLPFLSNDDYTPMSSSELYDYYGIYLQSAMPGGFKETSGAFSHGFYGMWDLNQFVFSSDETIEIMVYISKQSEMKQCATDFYHEYFVNTTINETDVMLSRYKYADDDICLYAAFEYNDCDLIVAATNVEESTFITVLENLISI